MNTFKAVSRRGKNESNKEKSDDAENAEKRSFQEKESHQIRCGAKEEAPFAQARGAAFSFAPPLLFFSLFLPFLLLSASIFCSSLSSSLPFLSSSLSRIFWFFCFPDFTPLNGLCALQLCQENVRSQQRCVSSIH